MRSERIKLLQDMAVFGAISSEALVFILDQCEEVTVRAGETFFNEGDGGTEMYVLETGSVVLLEIVFPLPAVLSLGAVYVLVARPAWFPRLVRELYRE